MKRYNIFLIGDKMSQSFYVDVKYANMISSRVRNFKAKGNNLWNFSCPYCLDSSKDKKKARGYIYSSHGTLLYRCHRCSIGTTFSKVLEHLDRNLYADYTLEKYSANCNHNHTPKFVFPDSTPKFSMPAKKSPLDELTKISNMSILHPAVLYVKNRMIPEEHWNLLYFCPKYKHWVKEHHKADQNTKDDTPRLIIPHFNQEGNLIGWAGRAFGPENLRYHNVKIGEDQLLYGLERVDVSRTIYVTEGQLDSLFIDNCIAASGVSAFDSEFMQIHKSNIVLIVDNEPRNIAIVKSVVKYISKGYSVCLFPDTVPEKDINEMAKAGLSKIEIENLIKGNTASEIAASLLLAQWRKI
jgi:hypothetical protein